MTTTFALRKRQERETDRQLSFHKSFVSRFIDSLSERAFTQTAQLKNSAAPPAPNFRPRIFTPLGCITIGGSLLALALSVVFVGYLFFTRDTTPAVTIIPSPTLLKPQEFLQSSRDLAQAVTDLNTVEYRFLQSAQANETADILRSTLQEIAARAMSVSVIASNLGATAASQDGASDASMQLASQYFGIARYGAALVIESQNAREGLASGAVTNEQAATVIAEYSARLWNPVVAESELAGNPFSQFLNDSPVIPQAQFISTDQLTNQLGGSPEVWMSAAPETVTVNLIVPNSTTSSNTFTGAESLLLMTTTEGQADANTARQLAASIIRGGGDTNILDGQPREGEVSAAFSSAVAISSPNGTPSRSIAAFPNGTVNATVIKAPDDIVSTIIALGPDNSPTIQSQTAIRETTPVVTLTISNLTIKQVNQRSRDNFNTFEADFTYEFDVQWQASLANPQFTLDCVSGNHFEITTVSGAQHISAKGLLILFPGAEDAYCYASRNGNTLGSASVQFLVGDPAGATQRAIQVETDSVSLDITLTADALGTLSADLNNAVATKAVIETENAVSTEVVGTQNAEFLATVTEIARRTQVAVPAVTETPLPTPTFVPVLVETLYIRGDQAALGTGKVLQRGRLYQFCFSGVVYLDTGGVEAYELMHVNGIGVPVSGCLAIEGTGAVAVITCGHGTPAEDPGGYSIQVVDLGPW